MILALAALLAACADKPVSPADDTAAIGGQDSGESGEGEGEGEDHDSVGDDPVGDGLIDTVQGTITWDVDFEDEALSDCSYTRTYTGQEDRSAPWLCPGCELLFYADVELSDGQDCYDQVTSSPPAEVEWLAHEAGLWYRASTSSMSERGASSLDGTTWTVEQISDPTSSDAGTVTYTINGTLSVGEAEGDILNGWSVSDSYACGWPKSDPPSYTGDYGVEVGGTLPDGLFPDVCEDTVRLHDFVGRYLIIDISAMDCGPCQSAAEDEPAFVAAMAEEGIEVEIITLLAPSLSETAYTASTDELQSWIDSFGLESPVLGDRMWGLMVIGDAAGEDFGYPAFAVVSPDLEVLDLHVGYSSFDDMAEIIRAHAGS